MKRSSLLVGSLAVGVALLGASRASANVVWKGDFSTGDLSQWSKLEITTEDRLQVVPDPADPSGKALRVLVRVGDDPIGASGYRNEVLYTADKPQEGEDRYYRWQTYWPEDYESADTWQLFTQWHHYDGGGSPPVSFYVRGEEVVLATADGSTPVVLWTAPLERGQWHDFVFHVKWSSDGSTGYVELWYDGRLELSSTPARTMFPGDSVYLKQGLYRNTEISYDQVVFHKGMTVGTTLDSVWPVETEPQAALQPAPDDEIVSQSWSETELGGGTAGCATAGAGTMLPAALVLGFGLWRRRRTRA